MRAAFFSLLLGAANDTAGVALPDAHARYFAAATANGACASIAVGLINGTEQGAWLFAGGQRSELADANAAAYEVGSVTDIFTGLLLAQAALDGKLRLADSIRSLMPKAFPWADEAFAVRPLTALVTQHGGLPPTPPNLFPADAEDPYAAYGETDLLALLANVRATAPAGTYSTLNAGLLGVLLGRLYGQDLPSLLTSRILVPLGMTHSGFDDADALVDGHAFGLPARHWHYGALAGAAGLRVTLADLLAFVRANLRPDASPLRGPLLLARQARDEGPAGGLGIGWNVHDVDADGQTWPLVWRASETGGFSTFIGYRTDRQQGLVLLSNSAAELAPVGLSLLTGQLPPNVPAAPFAPSSDQIEHYAGLYRLLDGGDVTVRREDVGLVTQIRGQTPWPLVPLAEDVFMTRSAAVGVTFVRNIDAISGLVLRVAETNISATRLSARAPRLARPVIDVGADKLAAFRGDYRLAPDLLLRVSTDEGRLLAHYTGVAAIPMRAYATDRFADADGVNGLVFHRGEDGRIDGVTVDLAGGERQAELAHWGTP